MPPEESRPITFPRIQERLRLEILFIALLLCLVYFISCVSVVVLARAATYVFSYFSYLIGESREAPASPELLAGLPIILAVAVGLALFHWFFAQRRNLDRTLLLMDAHPPDGEDSYHRRFVNVVEEFRVASGLGAVEPYVVRQTYLNAFALDDGRGRMAVAVTEGLLSSLSRAQLQAVLAHEFAHLVRRDSRVATLAVSMVGSLELILASLLGRKGPGQVPFFRRTLLAGGRFLARRITLIPWLVAVWLSLVLALFFSRLGTHLLYLALSRAGEEMADVTAVEILRDPLSLAQALSIIERNNGLAFQGYTPMGPLYFVGAGRQSLFGSLFNTHPPVSQRVSVLLNLAKTPRSELEAEVRRTRTRAAVIQAKLDFEGRPIFWSGVMEGSFAVPLVEPGARGLCPRCGTRLSRRQYEGAFVEACPDCGGKFVDHGSLQKIILREEVRFDDALERLAARQKEIDQSREVRSARDVDSSEPLVCPGCGDQLQRRFFTYAHRIAIDFCYRCNAYWFDANEMEIIQILVEEAKRERWGSAG